MMRLPLLICCLVIDDGRGTFRESHTLSRNGRVPRTGWRPNNAEELQRVGQPSVIFTMDVSVAQILNGFAQVHNRFPAIIEGPTLVPSGCLRGASGVEARGPDPRLAGNRLWNLRKTVENLGCVVGGNMIEENDWMCEKLQNSLSIFIFTSATFFYHRMSMCLHPIQEPWL